jgi:hypothetical protein
MGNGVTASNTASVSQQQIIDSLTAKLAKANERADELLARVGEAEARLASAAITGSSAYPSDALNKFAIEKKIEALDCCIKRNALLTHDFDEKVIYVSDIQIDIEQLRKEQE